MLFKRAFDHFFGIKLCSSVGDYAAGCLSPEYNPSPEGETQPNASFFQFSNAGNGGFGLF